MNDVPIFDVQDRGYRVRAFYVPETLNFAEQAHICVTRGDHLVAMGCYWAYRIWDMAAHFHDWVDEYIALEATPQ